MKRVKICVIAVLLLITLSLTLLSGCSVNLEKINEKNAEAIEFGFYTQTVEEYLNIYEGSMDTKIFEELKERAMQWDYIISFCASQAIRDKYDYILMCINRKSDIEDWTGSGDIMKKTPHILYRFGLSGNIRLYRMLR